MATLTQDSNQNIIEWTGLSPEGRIHSLPLLNLNSSREEILNYFNNSWTLTEALLQGLAKEEAFYQRPYHQLRHPLIFYYGHPAVLYVNKLRVAGLLEKSVNEKMELLFETGVDEMRWDDLHDGAQNIWPSLKEVTAYRKTVYGLIKNLIETHPLLDKKHLPITQQSPMWALVMGFEHERIHLETSSVLMRELPLEMVKKPKNWPTSLSSSKQTHPKNELVSIKGTRVALGKPQDWPTYGWDNEYGSETHQVDGFFASQFLVSNGEFKEFVQGGGYLNQKYWTDEGWEWRGFRNTKWPIFWISTGPSGLHEYKLRTIFEVIEMPWDWPACVNYHEALAYCAWRTEKENRSTPYRLLTEAEHHALRAHPSLDVVMKKDPLAQGFNMNLATGSESPVNALPMNDKGIFDSFGNVWQWCEDTFHPLSGGEPHPYYEDFSVPCYDGKHQMMLGGSFISTGDEASIWARFHFRPHFYQHAGLRLAADDPNYKKLNESMSYESREMFNKYMLMHWGTDAEINEQLPKFQKPLPDVFHLPKKCAELVEKYASHKGSAMDLGCAVGRASFEMAKSFEHVVGIDFSHEFVEAAKKLKTEKHLTYWRKDSGEQGQSLTAKVDPKIQTDRLEFEQGDACSLNDKYQSFDAVLLANVLCRLPNPRACLERMQNAKALVKPGGVLVMTTPFSWLEEYTPRKNWLDGISGVQKILTDFELIHEEELPFMIREHSRKFEYIVTKASVWRRKG